MADVTAGARGSEARQRQAPPHDVVITHELTVRTASVRDDAREAESLRTLTSDLLVSPRELLEKLAQIACELTGAPSGGISVIAEAPDGVRRFEWIAMAGRYARYVGGTTPLDHSPCGYTLWCGGAQLFHRPGRVYESLADAEPELVEGLVVPVYGARGEALATIWVAAHGDGPAFHSEDARILTSLAATAGAALQAIEARGAAERRAAELERVAQGASDANEAKTNFIATLAHEMRNPLAPILNSVRVLEHQLTDERLRQPLSILQRQSSQLSRLVEDLMDLSRIEHNELELRRSEVSIVQVIEQAVEQVAEQVAAKRQQIELQTADARIHVDESRLCAAIVNLLSNASKYTPADGAIRLRQEIRGRELVIQVADNGAGIAPELLPQLFSLYTRAHDAREQAPGLGIGLWLVQRVVELHGGSVSAHSDGLGTGATFTISLPDALATAGA